MSGRRYFGSSIHDLERLFESLSGDRLVMKDLLNELRHRDTARARALVELVREQLSGSDVRSPGGTPEASVPPATPLATPSATSPPRKTTWNGEAVPNPTHRQTSGGRPVTEPQGVLRPSSPPPPPKVKKPADFRNARTRLADEVETKPGPDSVLAAWLTQEVLTPQPLPDARELEPMRRTLVRFGECSEPWTQRRFARHGNERTVHWMVYLGELDLAKATEAILRTYPDEAADERADVRGNTTLAVVVLDEWGRPVKDKTFLSSFAWGYGQVRAGRLKGLAGFLEAERDIKTDLESRLIRQDEDGAILPLTGSDIQGAIGWLARVLNLPEEEVLRPGLAVRVPQWGAFNETPEPELLNSFFIGDLAKAREVLADDEVGQALSAYLGMDEPRARQDVVREKGLVSETLAPIRTPLSRWPGPGRHALVLMQQAAINHSVTELAAGGMVAINGPPGTGKTTLLRDVVAKVVLDRAVAMSKFDRPVEAFSHITSMRTGPAYTHLYRLHESLVGHEIVVASSNNRAVENISREIPSSSAIASDLDPPAQYFQSVSDAVAAGSGPIADGVTWGLAAAVLGNSANRHAFAQSFYWHKKRGMSLYLRAVLGQEIGDGDADDSEGRRDDPTPSVIALEQPPRGEIDALERWQSERREFLAKLANVEVLRGQSQAAFDAVRRKPAAVRQAEVAVADLLAANEADVSAAEKQQAAERRHAKAAEAERKAAEDRNAIDRLRPGFFARLFFTRSFRGWRARMAEAHEVLVKARSLMRAAAEAEEEAAHAASAARARVSACELEKQKADAFLAKIIATIEAHRAKAGLNLADEAFWAQDDSSLQLRSPWVFGEWQEARDALFVGAFALHRAFIDAAAGPLRHNLRAAIELLKGRGLQEQQEPARRSIWASLFLVVPVVSTTFASTARLFGPLGSEELGWLLIDEAGQATPQAAVGAILRAQRTVVIGDPLQIQPVVTTPPTLTRAIFSEFGVSTEEWAAPEISAQTLADRVSWFGTEIKTDDGDVWVGSPLRVHRRCQNPMFKIANHVAYNGLMVYGTPPATSPIGEVLGESSWADNSEGDAVGKWSESEGRRAADLLRKLLDAGLENPDIFFITPFRIVARQLREVIRSDRSVAARLPGGAWDWTQDRVGTVHTFQGKEADSVVIVLGAPASASAGARHWAGRPPNLLNVAVTRAKNRLYVIGNWNAWKDSGAFSHLARALPVWGRNRTPRAGPAPGRR